MHPLFFYRSLKYRVAIFIGLTVVLAMIAFALLVRAIVKPALYRVLAESAKEDVLLLEHLVTQEMLQKTPHKIQQLLSEIGNLPERNYHIKLRIIDENMVVHYSSSAEELGLTLDPATHKNYFFSYRNKPTISYLRPIKVREECRSCHQTDKEEIGYFNVILASSQIPIEKELSHSRILYLSLIIAISLFLALWLYISHEITSPLGKLSGFMQRAEEGQLDLTLEFDQKGNEIDKLKECFNRMIKSLKGSQQDLEQRIELRTKELAEANLQLNNKVMELDVIKSFNESIIQSLQNALITVNAECKISFTNNKVAEMLGWQNEEILGKSIGGLLCKGEGFSCAFSQSLQEKNFSPAPEEPSSDMENMCCCFSKKTLCLFRRVFYEGKDVEGEIEIYRRDGSTFPGRLSLSNLFDSDGSRLGITVIIRDLTKEKEMEASMKQIDRLSILGELMASLAHEIKNPLAGIQGAVQVLHEYFEEGDFRKEVSSEILGQFRRLDKVIMDLLRFSKTRRPDFNLVDVREMLRISLFLVNKQLEEKGIHLHQEVSSELPLLLGDSEQLQQVFLNLLLNAIQAVSEGGFIKIKADECLEGNESQTSHLLRVTIQDSGVGITPENISQIFNPFFTTKPKGTGLGLAIVQNIISQHQGRIEVKSQVKGGTTITLFLPVVNVADEGLLT